MSMIRRAWHFVICRPAFTNRDAFGGPMSTMLHSEGVCSCGKIMRRRN